MTRLAITLGIVGIVSSFAMGFEENFESYNGGDPIAGVNGWIENGFGECFQANAIDPGNDPGFLETRYADIGNNGQIQSGGAKIAHTFSAITSGTCVTEFDVSFPAFGVLDFCDIFVGDSSRQLDVLSLQAAAISVGSGSLRIFDSGNYNLWYPSSYTLTNDAWYHFWITTDLSSKEWQLQIAVYDEFDNRGTSTTVTYTDHTHNVHDTFSFRDSNVDDIGMIEFGVSQAVMEDDPLGRGMYVDNINVPEPTTLCLLSVTGFLAMVRRKK